MKKLSVVISAYNEESKISDCMQSVSFADEIILIDNESTDSTVAKAQKYTKKIFRRENNPMLNSNKNYGFSKAMGDYILSLDADERVDEELKNDILEVLKEGTEDGYEIPRKNYIFGQWIQHTGWYPDYQIRLFKKGKGRFPEKHVHELLHIVGNTAKLHGHILHSNYDTISQFIKKLDLYTSNEADQLISKGYAFNSKDFFRFPLQEFVARYYQFGGYKDGLHGMALSLLMAFYYFVVILKIWEKNSFIVQDVGANFLDNNTAELSRTISYWKLTKQISESSNMIVRLILRIKRKFYA